MDPNDFIKEVERLWREVQPLYTQLHCYTRTKLQDIYGKDRVPDRKSIPAHLLGNMWGQTWNNIFDLVKPFKDAPKIDVTDELIKQGYDAVKMQKLSEAFYVSLGLDPLPDTFWTRSMFTRPTDGYVYMYLQNYHHVAHPLLARECVFCSYSRLYSI